MRKLIIPIVTAVSAISMSVPASAQWAPPVYRYQPYNYTTSFSHVRFAQSMQIRVQRIRNDIRMLDARNVLSPREARSLDRQALNVQRNIRRASRYGLQVGEARALERQIRNLEYRVQREASDWNNRPNRRHR